MRRETSIFDVLQETLVKLSGEGLLLVAGDPPNPMTIGWGTIGPIWYRQIFTVMVRPVRYTYELMERSTGFTVNIMDDRFSKELAVCGTRSGRNFDKFAATGLTPVRSSRTDGWFIAESAIHFDCRIVHKHLIDPSALDPAISRKYYPKPDFHMVYYGEITGVFRDDDAMM